RASAPPGACQVTPAGRRLCRWSRASMGLIRRVAAQPVAGRRRPLEVMMGHRGEVLSNPGTGERFVFHATSGDTAGKVLEFDLVWTRTDAFPAGTFTRVSRRALRCWRER